MLTRAERQETSWTEKVLLVVLWLIGLSGLAYLGLMGLFLFMLRDNHSLRDYPSLRARWNPDLVAHFPDPIPHSATLKKFSHFPGFLQGGAHIQLRLALPPDEIQELHGRFLQQRTKSFFGGEWTEHVNEVDGMPTTWFKTGDGDESSFPDDFEIMIFDPLIPESERPNWNHGRSHGVAISTERNEIVYWAESW